MDARPVRIAICLLTCDRTEYTQRTLQTLAAQNELGRFILLHGDDASQDQAGPDLARAMGFETVVQSRKRRRGVAAMTADLIAAAQRVGAKFVLNLQNDWESKRPVPLSDAAAIFADPQVYCLRMYGAFKSAHGRAGIHHGGREPLKVVRWAPHVMAGYEVGDIHWGHPPAITRIGHAVKLTAGARCERETRQRSGRITDLTVRVIDNVFSHIGRERTPDFAA